ncbi:Kelch repeat-containing protein [Cyclobacterium salsum]|uniref:hypothetical protein n=1 Tax=Cyclobacterium salsum TaxID=2666329 RepID=UPI0013910125|nr:hypothetical protein [Cyclobacterium salsum]
MKKYLHHLVTILILHLFGCVNPEMTPRTNPRFSVAFIQEIDESGAEFAANVYDFGSEEILEYGFLYSTHWNPRPAYAEELKQTGKPEKYFILKAEHSMAKGEIYYVVAYVKTLSGVVYSEPHPFVSKGTVGFIFEKFDYNQPLFFGDTVAVYGENLSSVIANYKVTFQGEEARVIEVQKHFFKFIIPDFQNFDRYSEPDVFRISMEIVDKEMEMNVLMPFREPEFADMAIQQIDYGGTVEILGDYLVDPNLVVTISPQPSEYPIRGTVTMVSADRNKIVFKPNPVYAGEENVIELEIRGKKYNLGSGVFKYNPTELDPGQHIVTGYGDQFSITGKNINYAAPYYHRGVLNGQTYEINYEQSNSETLSLRFVTQGYLFDRINDFRVQTFDNVSQNSATIELTDPDIPFMRKPIPSIALAEYLRFGNMTSFEGKGYALGNKEIFEVAVASRSMTPLRALQLGTYRLSFTFSVAHGENWYLGGGQTTDLNPSNRAFFVFNLRSGEIRRLPDLPLDQRNPMLVHVVNDHLYVEGGHTPERGEDHRLRYKFDIRSEKWVRLPDKEEGRMVVGRTVPFTFNGRHLAFGEPDGTGDEHSGLFEFDLTTERWNLVKRFSDIGRMGVKTDEVFIVGNKAILMGIEIFVLDLETMEMSQVTNLSHPSYLTCEFLRVMAFMANGKIYAWDCNETFWEIDPERFDNW